LPDLRGVDPVIGAILFQRDSGATCHVMDDGIDTGAIVSQVRIPYSDDLDVATLYQLSFVAEQMAFKQALECQFSPLRLQCPASDNINYRRKPEDRVITFSEPNKLIFNKIKAFCNKSQGCQFTAAGGTFVVYAARTFHNQFIRQAMSSIEDGVVYFLYENSIVFKKDGEIIQFQQLSHIQGRPLSVGDKLFG
jgi:methionyl-tRNA formyltransferase